MAISYIELGDFCDVAAEILGTTAEQIAGLPNIGLADSALVSPQAGWGEVDRYPTLLEKAAILLEHLTRNHPLPDGNKRTAFVLTVRFLEANGLPAAGRAAGHRRADSRADRRWKDRSRRNPRVAIEAHGAEDT